MIIIFMVLYDSAPPGPFCDDILTAIAIILVRFLD
jgi:hypothetical protein